MKFDFMRRILRFKELNFLGLGNITSACISGVFWFYFASILGPSEYGKIGYLLSIGGIIGVISFFGAGTTITVSTAKNEKIQATIFSWVVISSSIASIITYLVFHNYVISLYIIGYGIFNVSVADILGKKQFINYAKFVIYQKIIWVTLSIVLYYFIGIDGIILGLAISFLSYSFVIISGYRETEFSINVVRKKFRLLLNNYILDLSKAFTNNIDKIIIVPIFGFTVLGNYQLGLQFLSLLSILPNIIFQYILPNDATGNLNKGLKKILILFSIVLALIGITLPPIIIPYFFPKFIGSTEIIQIMSLAIIPISINTTYVSKFLGNGRNRLVVIGSGISIGFLVPSIILLGQTLGIIGISFAYLISIVSESIFFVTIERLNWEKIRN